MTLDTVIQSLLLLPLWGAAAEGIPGPSYQLVAGARPDTLLVRFTPEGTQPFTLLPARTLSGTTQRALPTLTCLESGARVTPDQPIKCRELSWQITLKPVPATGADASAQQNLYFPQGGWLVTEWGDFPRQQGAEPGRVCLPDGRCSPLPGMKEPPLILPFALPATARLRQGSRLQIHHDRMADALDIPQLQKQLEAIVDYLAFQLDAPPARQPWQLVWLARDISTHSLGGAAGAGTIVANYPVSDNQPTADTPLRLLRTSAHEAVHMLDTRARPTWVAESLAEYLAIKSLRRFRLHSTKAADELAQHGARLPHADAGLYRANDAVKAGDLSYYPLFYLKGSAFWEALELALQPHHRTLSALLPRLSWQEDGRFDTSSSALLAGTLGNEVWQSLIRRYLSGQE
ncbi:hypothetical protein CK910_00100 [Aeromonas sp. CA23]|uniref:hypothetical protein n=1 Tax=Aeromonas sp. CA23 TaxID=2033032 RepID=UPI000BFB9D06|nr:hypothetical protein [Aeromonas sp. CA23]ATL97056.1 hypothetical protein CK910_00100 [Aeromonas sp. CA23]